MSAKTTKVMDITNNNNNVDEERNSSSEMPRITHVIFDLDGLLLDTEFAYEQATQQIVQRYGRSFTLEDKLKILGRPGSVVARMIVDDLKLPISVSEFMQQFDEEYCNLVNVQPVPLMPGAERLIRHLNRFQIPTAIATGSRRFTYELNTKFHKNLFQSFHHVLMTPEDPEVTRGKPDPQPYLICAKRFENVPTTMIDNNRSILVFEDSLVGIESANRAGMTTVWIPDYRFDRHKHQHQKQQHSSSLSSSWSKPCLVLDSLKLFQPELFGLPQFLDD
nr:pseudouridine-5'-phosphatase-like [Dermatophagoides farinae]